MDTCSSLVLLQTFNLLFTYEVYAGEPGHTKLSCRGEAAKAANVIGAYIPKCQSNGLYEPLQCHGSTGICWCSNEYGERIPNALIKGTPCSNPCFKKTLNNPPPTILLQGAPKLIRMGITAPNCDSKGYFQPKQCDRELCWCVDKIGNKVPHTRGNPQQIEC